MMYQKIKNSVLPPPLLYKCIVILVAAATLILTACGGLNGDDGEKNIRINLPPIEQSASGNSRALSDDRLPMLKTETKRYRVTVNDIVREGTESSYEFTLPVGIRATAIIECLNSSGEVIIRAVKDFTVSSGENSVDINLKNDGNEIMPASAASRVTYSYGEADRHGNKSGIPSDPTTYSEGDLFEVKDGSGMTWDHASQSGFTGWSANVALVGDTASSTADVQANGNVQAGGKYKMPRGGVVLTAQWNKKTYQIRYNANEPEDVQGNKATVTGMPQQATSVTALDDATAAAAPTITNPFDSKNWTFTGWNTQAGGGGTVYKSGQQIAMMTEDITLYAQWTSANVYTVTYNIGSGPSSADSGWIDDDRYTVGTSPAITLPTLTATGYDFLGWRIDGESNNRGGGTSYTPTANVTATAQWSIKTYNITYSMNAPSGATGTSGTVSSTTREYMAEFTLATNSFVVPGYEFTGWYRNDGGGEEKVGDSGATVNSQNFIYVAEDMALYAKWNATQYTINFAAGTGGSGTESTTIPNFTVESTSLSLPSTTTLTAPTAKLFDNGWSLTDGGTTKITSAQDVINAIKAGSGITISGNTITLYAVWKDAAASVTDSSDDIEQFYDTFTAAWSAYQTLAQQGGSTATVKLYTNASSVAIEIIEMGSITLDLNELTLSGNGTAPVITINHPDAQLTITGDGTITGGKIGIKAVDGYVTMENGTISGNTADNGAGVYCAGGSFEMQDGHITGNTATGVGGGVYCENSQFSMSGGEITGNTATGNGGGVYVVADYNLYIDGSVNITGNKKGSTTDNNVYLASDATGTNSSRIGIGSDINAGSRIGVTLATVTGVFTSGWANCSLTDAPSVFTSDAGYTVAVNGSSYEVELQQ